MLLDEGKNRIRDLLNTDIDKGQFGTGTTSESISDTAIETALSDTLVTNTSTTAQTFLKEISTLNSLLSTGQNISEFVLIKSSSSKLISRSVFTAVNKPTNIELRGSTIFFIK